MSGDKWTKTLRMKQIQVKNIELLEQVKEGSCALQVVRLMMQQWWQG